MRRGGAVLSFAEALAGWGPAMSCAALFGPLVRTSSEAWALAGVVAAVAVATSVVLADGRPNGLVAHAMDAGWHWLGYPIALPFFVRTDWTDGPLAWVALASAAIALIAGSAQALIGWRARAWLPGTLRDGDPPRVETARRAYALDALPRGAEDGDPVTVPAVHRLEGEAGPYRSTARPVGLASAILLVDGQRLSRALLLRGALLIAWALATGARVALPGPGGAVFGVDTAG